MVTLGAVCVGLTAVRFALDERIDLAVIALVVAMFMDGLDGRLARALNSTSLIGKELDSLADFFQLWYCPRPHSSLGTFQSVDACRFHMGRHHAGSGLLCLSPRAL